MWMKIRGIYPKKAVMHFEINGLQISCNWLVLLALSYFSWHNGLNFKALQKQKFNIYCWFLEYNLIYNCGHNTTHFKHLQFKLIYQSFSSCCLFHIAEPMEQIKDIPIRMQNKKRIWMFVILSTLDSLRGGLVEFCGWYKREVISNERNAQVILILWFPIIFSDLLYSLLNTIEVQLHMAYNLQAGLPAFKNINTYHFVCIALSINHHV